MIEPLELQTLQHLSFGDYVTSSPYPTWCKDYTDAQNPIMLWISRSYEKIFNCDQNHYGGKSDFDSGYWSKQVCEQFRQNDLKAIEIGMFSAVELIDTGIDGWQHARVTKWCASSKHFGHRLQFVYGLGVPLNDRAKRLRA